MDDHTDMSPEDSGMFDLKIIVTDFGTPQSSEKKSVKPQQMLEVPPAMAEVSSEPYLTMDKCDVSRQMKRVAPAGGDVEICSNLSMTLETSSTSHNSSPSTESVTVVKGGIKSTYSEDDSKADLDILTIEGSDFVHKDFSQAAGIAYPGDQKGPGFSPNQDICSMENLKTVSDSGKNCEMTPMQNPEFCIADPSIYGSHEDIEPVPAALKEDGLTESRRIATTSKETHPQSPSVRMISRPRY
jgi:hypothetical protein